MFLFVIWDSYCVLFVVVSHVVVSDTLSLSLLQIGPTCNTTGTSSCSDESITTAAHLGLLTQIIGVSVCASHSLIMWGLQFVYVLLLWAIPSPAFHRHMHVSLSLPLSPSISPSPSLYHYL